jgi:hypothetical protein
MSYLAFNSPNSAIHGSALVMQDLGVSHAGEMLQQQFQPSGLPFHSQRRPNAPNVLIIHIFRPSRLREVAYDSPLPPPELDCWSIGACSVGIRTSVCGRGSSESAFFSTLTVVLSSPSLGLGIFTMVILVRCTWKGRG